MVGRLPAPSSDQAGAAIGSTAYIVGGYTGTALARHDRCLAAGARGAGRRASAVAAALRGGNRGWWPARDRGWIETRRFRERRRALVQAGRSRRRPRSAACADDPRRRRDAGRHRLRRRRQRVACRERRRQRSSRSMLPIAGCTSQVVLPERLSDLAAVGLGDRILVAGGRGPGGTVASVQVLRAHTALVSAQSPVNRVPALLDAHNVYAADGANQLRGAARFALPRIYVPNSKSDTVDVIDPRTYKIVGHFAVGGLPQHVVPSYDLKTLYVTNDTGNSLTPIDPRTGKPGPAIPVDDPYNMYFTPDGRFAIVVAEALHRLDFRDAHTFHLRSFAAGAVPRRRSHRLLRGRPLPDRELRVLGPADQGRRPAAAGRGNAEPAPRRDAAGRQALAGRARLLRRGHDVERPLEGRRTPAPGDRASCRRGAAPTACTRAEMRACSTSRTGTPARSRSSASPPARS